MIVTNTFASKCNTIVDGSLANTGRNPIMQLYYGNMHTRGLIYFDIKKVEKLVEDKTYFDPYNLHHVLKMWNASDINIPGITKRFPDSYLTGMRERATSYELLLLTVPQYWEAGRGFDFSQTKTLESYRAYSEYGSNWYNATTETPWRTPGVYDTNFILEEMAKEESDIIVSRQRFDFGNEPIEFDITDIFTQFITGDRENNGFLIMFSPLLEEKKTKFSQYSGFFTNNTNTFFEPYVQTTYDETIEDDRASFYLDKWNKIYFYANVAGNNVNLDNVPSCKIDGKTYIPQQQGKGVYYVKCRINSTEETAPTSHNDVWGGIKYERNELPEVRLRFTSLPSQGYYQFGLPYDTERKPRFVATLSGVNRNEKIIQGELRRLVAHVRAQYTSDQECPDAKVDYRVYTVFDNKELDVINWYPVDKEYNTYVIPIGTDNFVPQTYHIDLRIKYGNEVLLQPDVACFDVVSKADKLQS